MMNFMKIFKKLFGTDAPIKNDTTDGHFNAMTVQFHDMIRQAEEKIPSFPIELQGKHFQRIGILLLKAGNHTAGARYMTKGEEMGAKPGNAETMKEIEINLALSASHLSTAEKNLSKGDVGKAIAILENAVKENPFDANLLSSLAFALSNKSKEMLYDPGYNSDMKKQREAFIKKALEIATKAVDVDPFFALATYNKGMVYIEAGWISDALALFKEALNLNDPDFTFHIENCQNSIRVCEEVLNK
jgi:tetratricopeptide (TPR) repeat protein